MGLVNCSTNICHFNFSTVFKLNIFRKCNFFRHIYSFWINIILCFQLSDYFHCLLMIGNSVFCLNNTVPCVFIVNFILMINIFRFFSLFRLFLFLYLFSRNSYLFIKRLLYGFLLFGRNRCRSLRLGRFVVCSNLLGIHIIQRSIKILYIRLFCTELLNLFYFPL